MSLPKECSWFTRHITLLASGSLSNGALSACLSLCRVRVGSGGAHPVACACMVSLVHSVMVRGYSMPLRRIWLAAISITLIIKAMANAQIRLFRTQVCLFCFWACTAREDTGKMSFWAKVMVLLSTRISWAQKSSFASDTSEVPCTSQFLPLPPGTFPNKPPYFSLLPSQLP